MSAAASSTCLASANTATIRPPAGRLPNNRPRCAISRAPSARLNTPATHAAAYWPTLCPRTTSGSMPQDCHSRARPSSTANRAGCANEVCRNASRSSRAEPNNTSSSGRATMSSTASAQRVTVSAKTGSVTYNSRAIPGYWLPCPVNSHAVVGAVGVLTADDTGPQPVLGQFGQAFPRGLDRIHRQCGPVFEVRTAGPGGVAQVGQVDVGMGAQPVRVAVGKRGKGFR